MSEVIQEQPKKKYYDYISVGNRTKQEVYFVEQHDKHQMFELFIQKNPNKQTVVITKSKRKADELVAFLRTKAIVAKTVHGNHKKEEIEKTKIAFNDGDIQLLITTEIIFFSLELQKIEMIINYDLPLQVENYFKTLRYVDEVGISISFISYEDEKTLDIIELMMKYNIPQLEIEEFEHTPLPKINKKDKRKKPRHKKSKKKSLKTEENE